tara:strand:+ start:7563 stop:7712 length:150 start_codon:yes stop_codon:yes gene_type:complete
LLLFGYGKRRRAKYSSNKERPKSKYFSEFKVKKKGLWDEMKTVDSKKSK